MNKSILVLDENSVIHGLVTSALETEGLTLHHEFNPGRYVERASSLMPDLILIGNSEGDPEYRICRQIKDSRGLSDVPLVLLAGSKESLTRDQISGLRVAGVVRKPFEASDLQQQVSKHLNLVDLIGSAYEYRQSQSTAEDGSNPLANLDVLDDEVLGMLRGTAPMPEEAPEPAPAAGAPVVDDEVLAETLQPERAFEPIEAEAPAAPGPRFDSLETLEGEFPSETLEMPESEAQLDELGAADVLEEETAEEAVFEPQGFDQDFGAGPAAPAAEGLDDIEVELPEDATELRAMDAELQEGSVELFESDLAPSPEAGGEFEESIPLSVRRMMELKPVFTMTQEASAQDEEVLEPFDFEPEPSEVKALQDDIDELAEVDLDAEGEDVQEQELEFASEHEVKAMEEDLEPPEEFDLMGGEAERPARAAKPEPEPEPLEVDLEEAEAAEIDEGFAEELAAQPAPEPPKAQPAPAPKPEPEPEPVAAAAPAEDEDFFVEEYLGEEEIDEEQIMAAEDEEGVEEAPELSAEDEAELEELLAEDEHLADLDNLEDLEEDELIADDADEPEEDIELESEEEELVQTSLRAEREAETAVVQPRRAPLFERNFNALQEEGAAGPEGDETWQLEQEDGGFAISDEQEAGEVISLHSPEPEEPIELEEMPSSALEEVIEEEEGPASIEFGEGEGDVFEEGEPETPWKPKAPPSFVAQPAEDFPQDAVKEPFTGPHGEPTVPEPPLSPRHVPVEVLEDPDSLSPVLEEPTEAVDLAESVQPHELEAEELEAMEPDELEEPALSVLTDHALGGGAPPPVEDEATFGSEEVLDEDLLDQELGAEPGEQEWQDEEEMVEAFEPLAPEGDATGSADVTRGEMDALLSQPTDEVTMEDVSEEEALEPVLGVGDESAAQASASTGNIEFDNLFASLQEEIAANPEGEHLDDVLRKERIRDRALAMDFSLPQHENTFARALGVYELPGDGGARSVYPAALMGAGAAAATRLAAPAAPRAAAAQTLTERPAAPAAAASVARSAADVSALTLLDPDIRAKLGQVLDEIISISVRKAVQEEMPKIMERMSRDA